MLPVTELLLGARGKWGEETGEKVWDIELRCANGKRVGVDMAAKREMPRRGVLLSPQGLLLLATLRFQQPVSPAAQPAWRHDCVLAVYDTLPHLKAHAAAGAKGCMTLTEPCCTTHVAAVSPPGFVRR